MTWAMLGAHFLLVSFMRTISGVQDVIDKLIESTYQSRNRQLSLTERIIDVISQTAQQRTSAQSSEETPKPPATE
jgi:hypothetical protein